MRNWTSLKDSGLYSVSYRFEGGGECGVGTGDGADDSIPLENRDSGALIFKGANGVLELGVVSLRFGFSCGLKGSIPTFFAFSGLKSPLLLKFDNELVSIASSTAPRFSFSNLAGFPEFFGVILNFGDLPCRKKGSIGCSGYK